MMNEIQVNPYPTVSVIMPCYNQSRIIGRAIESVVSQSYPNLQLIVMDDCSRDDSVAVIDSWQRRYPDKIALYVQPQNVGHARNMNTGYSLCTGEMITFCDGDDWYYPDKIRNEVERLRSSSGYQVCYSNYDFYNESGVLIDHWVDELRPLPEGDIFVPLYTLDYPQNIHLRYEMMPRRALDEVGYYDESIRGWLDWDYRLRLARVYQFGYVPIAGSAYTLQQLGLTRSLEDLTLLDGWRMVVEKHRDQIERYDNDCQARIARRVDWQDRLLRQLIRLTRMKGSKLSRLPALVGFLARYPRCVYEYPFLIDSLFGNRVQKMILRLKDNCSTSKPVNRYLCIE